MTTYEHALVGDAVRPDVEVTVEDGVITGVSTGSTTDASIAGEVVAGLTMPGLANCHSHAFHRALRARTQTGRGSFWTWRDQMYQLAATLTPDSYRELAVEVYAEMRATGITAVGEFHYLHHQPDGTPYNEANAMGHALIEAARRAGIRITLLDTCYLSSGFGAPPEGAQVRYDDGSAAAWAERVSGIEAADHARVGAAVHSVRAVPRDQLPAVVEAAAGTPLHVHLSEQVGENDRCVRSYGATPTQVLADAGVLGPLTSAVHATHLTAADVGLLGGSATYACFCPTTERDLGDGIGPSRALHDAGSALTLGSDSHAVVDLFEEMRAVELDERLATQRRGHWTAAELLTAGTRHDSLGWADAGAIAVGQRADLVTIATDDVRTAGTGADEQTVVFAAAAENVTQVVADGYVVFRADDRGRLGRDLADVIGRLWR
jgi:formiminoglutamate deiminase